MDLCALARHELLRDETAKSEFVARLDHYLNNGIGDTLFIAREILTTSGELSDAQADTVLEHYANNLTPYDLDIGNLLVEWLNQEFAEDRVQRLLRSLKRGLEILDNYPWEIREFDDSFRFLFFPLAYWRMGGQPESRSTAVFLRGLKFLFSKRMDNKEIAYPHEVMRRIEPLISHVSQALLREVLRSGGQSADPTIRALSRIFSFGTASSKLEEHQL